MKTRILAYFLQCTLDAVTLEVSNATSISKAKYYEGLVVKRNDHQTA